MSFNLNNRRDFLKTAILGGAASFLFRSPAQAARAFTKTLTNYCRFPGGTFVNLCSGKAKASVHAWVFANSFSGVAADNQIFNAVMAAAGSFFRMSVNGTAGANKFVRIGCKSVNSDALQVATGVTSLNTGQWYSLGGVCDLTNKAIRIYINGVQDKNQTGLTLANATFTPAAATNNDWIGAQGQTNPTTTDLQWDGSIAEVALWTDDITTAGFLQLAAGFKAPMVLPQNLVSYFPIIGNNSPETDVMGSGAQGTIAGSLPEAAHPRIIY